MSNVSKSPPPHKQIDRINFLWCVTVSMKSVYPDVRTASLLQLQLLFECDIAFTVNNFRKGSISQTSKHSIQTCWWSQSFKINKMFNYKPSSTRLVLNPLMWNQLSETWLWYLIPISPSRNIKKTKNKLGYYHLRNIRRIRSIEFQGNSNYHSWFYFLLLILL